MTILLLILNCVVIFDIITVIRFSVLLSRFLKSDHDELEITWKYFFFMEKPKFK